MLTQLHVERIESNNGFTIIQTDIMTIPVTFNYTLHVVELNDLENLLISITQSISELNNTQWSAPLDLDVQKIQDKLLTLHTNPHSINKRGLFNAIGTINKWICGTMDDEDRQLVNEHFQITDTNNHEIINTMNQQIHINANFNTSINTLKDTIEKDREMIKNTIRRQSDITVKKLAILNIRLTLHELDKIVTQLQDTITLSKLGIVHSSLLTHTEILKYKIDAEKIRNMNLGFAETTRNKLVFLIKIPFESINANVKRIVPLSPINSCAKIQSPITRIIEYNKTLYNYENNKPLSQLHKLDHCISYKNCNSAIDCKSDFITIDDDIIIIQKAKNTILKSTCDEREFSLFGNYFIKFYNCTIHIDNNTFYNNIQEITNKYTIPNLNYMTDNTTLTFTDIIIAHTENTKQITELTHFKHITTYSSITIIVIIILTIFIYLYFKHKPTVKIVNKIQENLESNEGRVTYAHYVTKAPTPKHNAHDTVLF